MARWIEETFHPHWRVRLAADEVLHEVKTGHQHLVIFTNATWGTVLMSTACASSPPVTSSSITR